MEDTINFLYDQVRALQKKVNKLEQDNDEATRIINNLIE